MAECEDSVNSTLGDSGSLDRADDLVIRSLRHGDRNIAYVEHPGTAGCLVYDANKNAVLLVRQFRPVIGGDTLEIPSGIVNEGETPMSAARRETQEETGYIVKELSALGEINSSVGLTTEVVSLFWTDVFADTEVGPEEGMTTIWVPLDQALPRILEFAQKDAKTLAGLSLLKEQLRTRAERE